MIVKVTAGAQEAGNTESDEHHTDSSQQLPGIILHFRNPMCWYLQWKFQLTQNIRKCCLSQTEKNASVFLIFGQLCLPHNNLSLDTASLKMKLSEHAKDNTK